jgi:zinc transporter ZupT
MLSQVLGATVAAVTLAAESGEHHEAWVPYAIAGSTLFILLAMLVGLVAFGGGREHS